MTDHLHPASAHGTIVVKLCGIRSVEHALAAAAAGADCIGFVFVAGRRAVDVHTARQMASAVRACASARRPPQLVGVFADAPVEAVNAIAVTARLDAVQLCGTESPAYAARIEVPVHRALHVRPGVDLAALAAPYADVATLLVLDTWQPGTAGGTGQSFDWALARATELPLPVMLAGGLHPGNVAAAIAVARPYGVDVSSGIEQHGTKHPGLMEAFVREARRAASTGACRDDDAAPAQHERSSNA